MKTPDNKEYEVLKTSEIKLVMEDLVMGDGPEAKASSTITINYHGTLAKDGKVFDGNWGKDPATFALSQLIEGWQLGIPGMKVGGIRKLTIPWQFAYGERGGRADPGEGRPGLPDRAQEGRLSASRHNRSIEDPGPCPGLSVFTRGRGTPSSSRAAPRR